MSTVIVMDGAHAGTEEGPGMVAEPSRDEGASVRQVGALAAALGLKLSEFLEIAAAAMK